MRARWSYPARVDDDDQRFAALRGLWNNHLMRVELNAAKELARISQTRKRDEGFEQDWRGEGGG